MYTCQNGWTKETMKAAIMKGNNGTKSSRPAEGNFAMFNPPGSEFCLYGGPGENHCAVGCFIPENQLREFHRFMEGKRIDVIWAAHGFDKTMPLCEEGMAKFQQVHDTHKKSEPGIREKMLKFIDDNVREEPVTLPLDIWSAWAGSIFTLAAKDAPNEHAEMSPMRSAHAIAQGSIQTNIPMCALPPA